MLKHNPLKPDSPNMMNVECSTTRFVFGAGKHPGVFLVNGPCPVLRHELAEIITLDCPDDCACCDQRNCQVENSIDATTGSQPSKNLQQSTVGGNHSATIAPCPRLFLAGVCVL